MAPREILVSKGLVVDESSSRGNGEVYYQILKPVSAGGNCLPVEYYDELYDGMSDSEVLKECFPAKELVNAPIVTIMQEENKWSCFVHLCFPGPGPGDFREIFSSESAAVDCALRYFFDKDSKMVELIKYETKRISSKLRRI